MRLLLCGDVLYTSAYIFLVSTEMIVRAAKKFLFENEIDSKRERTRRFALNLAGSYAIQQTFDSILSVLPMSGFVFGNEEEFQSFNLVSKEKGQVMIFEKKKYLSLIHI